MSEQNIKYVVEPEQLNAIGNEVRRLLEIQVEEGENPVEKCPVTIDNLITTSSETPGKIEEVYEKGKAVEYDKFWDTFQQNGKRTNYRYAFSHWIDSPIPKHSATIDATGIGSAETFIFCGKDNTKDDKMVDVSAACAKLDFSKCEEPNNLFLNAFVKNITINLESATKLNSTFSEASGGKHENIKLKVSASCAFNLTFAYCGNLTTLEFLEGSEIGQNGLDLHWSPLTRKSLENVINTLSDTTTGLTVTLSLSAVNKAFETSEGANDGSTSTEWATLEGSKINWTINLI